MKNEIRNTLIVAAVICSLLGNSAHVPIVLSAELRYQRWELFGDGQYMEVGASATLPGLLFTNANVHLKDGLAEGFLGY